MATERARATADFTYYFRSLVGALGERPGWYGVFAEREPGAAHAFESGTDVPPWDVVRAVLHDLAAARGVLPDEGELARARALHRAAVTAWDAVPGAAQLLRARFDSAVRARDVAILREREAVRAHDQAAAHPGTPAVARLANVVAWARDDRERAIARCEELGLRLAAVTSGFAARPLWRDDPQPHPGADRDPDPGGRAARAASWGAGRTGDREGKRSSARPRGARFAGAYEEPAPDGGTAAHAPEHAAPEPAAAESAAPPPAAPAKPRGARFAGAPVAEQSAAPGTAAAVPPPPAPAKPRGARFAGAPAAAAEPVRRPADPRWTAEARAEAARLGELRRGGQTGAAYVVLTEAAVGPPQRLPYLVRELERTGLGADVATLLWETAALPPAPLAAAAAALAAEGRAGECRTLLRQAAARPAGDIAVVAADLTAAGRPDEAGELLETVARARPAEDAAAVVRVRPALAAALVAAAERISKSRRRDIVAALRRAGLPDA